MDSIRTIRDPFRSPYISFLYSFLDFTHFLAFTSSVFYAVFKNLHRNRWMETANDDRILIFGWAVPLNHPLQSKLHTHTHTPHTHTYTDSPSYLTHGRVDAAARERERQERERARVLSKVAARASGGKRMPISWLITNGLARFPFLEVIRADCHCSDGWQRRAPSRGVFSLSVLLLLLLEMALWCPTRKTQLKPMPGSRRRRRRE